MEPAHTTPKLEAILNEIQHPDVNLAIDELQKLKEINHHLIVHFSAVQRQTEVSASALSRIADAIRHQRLRCAAVCPTVVVDITEAAGAMSRLATML